jgi:hypothetical protein
VLKLQPINGFEEDIPEDWSTNSTVTMAKE